jgi:hypothetical protein
MYAFRIVPEGATPLPGHALPLRLAASRRHVPQIDPMQQSTKGA